MRLKDRMSGPARIDLRSSVSTAGQAFNGRDWVLQGLTSNSALTGIFTPVTHRYQTLLQLGDRKRI